ncbi:hypothetical protein S40288_05110 [Stachybotrys chartarum IBT 40288]|nr:hypothetical protein S40288_05110 [Stachybotrys chartarum IBT 40288]
MSSISKKRKLALEHPQSEPARDSARQTGRHQRPASARVDRGFDAEPGEPYDVSDENILDKLQGVVGEIEVARRLLAVTKDEHDFLPRYQIVYRIRCQASGEEGDYEKPPWLVNSGPHNAHLRASSTISNMELYLERNKQVAFLVYVNFECCSRHPVGRRGHHERRHVTDGIVSRMIVEESVVVVSERMQNAFRALAAIALEGIPHPTFANDSQDNNGLSDAESTESSVVTAERLIEEPTNFTFPYLWWFNRRSEINDALPLLDDESRLYLAVFQSYIQDYLEYEWNQVDELLSQRQIAIQYLPYIYVPGQILVEPKGGKPAHLKGFELKSWLHGQTSRDGDSLSLKVRSWLFDGTFNQVQDVVGIVPPQRSSDPFDIRDLNFYPIEFSSDEAVANLKGRGRMFWKCRTRNYVFHRELAGDKTEDSTESRFMVDMDTYKTMHRKEDLLQTQSPVCILDPEIMKLDNPGLKDSFFMCLPSKIPGFNMQKKEWGMWLLISDKWRMLTAPLVELDVHHLADVEWNTKAFDYLVIEPATRELIQAVVMNQLGGRANSDLIQGKGNGLFLLLHGGPGTGKTMTAESVAEITKRPLYRVTCGDIGTKAEEVERYLEVVLHLGTKWGCVVLLDEADVFLEQRSMHNLERNALVSVFLRVLEYYDGILILTSNRVGTFDEAFKSRIQLSLRYSNLGQPERLQIWKNFVLHLDTFQETVKAESTCPSQIASKIGHGFEISSLEENLEALANENLNGREIRNVLSTARQLALFRGESLQYKHLKSVLHETKKFDKYLQEVHLGFTQDDIQRNQLAR